MARRRRTSRRNKGFGAAGVFRAAFLVFLLAAGAAAWLVFAPFGPEKETFVLLAPGSSTIRMGRQLEATGIVRSQFAFDLVRWWKRGTLKAGEYRFDHPASVTEVYARIARGDVFTKTVIVPEGESLFEIADRMEKAGFGPRRDFLAAASRQVGLVADLDPRATSLEGYLVRRFRAEAAQLGLKGNVHRVVTMASLVERETAVDAERPLVASVFENRIEKKMPLMTDPAVIYGLEVDGRWRGTIYASDLKLDTPYNTYLHAGLPPGPIANPGLKSLRAAMEPAKTDYLYFVAAGANPQGRSLFSSTLEEHARNVAGYRHAVKKTGGM
jgi:UPF0755 protein